MNVLVNGTRYLVKRKVSSFVFLIINELMSMSACQPHFLEDAKESDEEIVLSGER